MGPAAIDQFQNERTFFDAVDNCDIRMIEGGQHLRFSLEARHAVGIPRQRFGQNLDRHIAVELGICGAPHLTHTTFAKLRMNAVMSNGLSRAHSV